MMLTKQKFKTDTFFVYLAYAFRYLGLLVLIPYYGRVLGPDSYGQFLTTTALMAIILAVITYGFYMRGSRDIACAKSRQELNDVFNAHVMGRVVLIPIAFVLVVIGWYLSEPISGDFTFAILALSMGIA